MANVARSVARRISCSGVTKSLFHFKQGAVPSVVYQARFRVSTSDTPECIERSSPSLCNW